MKRNKLTKEDWKKTVFITYGFAYFNNQSLNFFNEISEKKVINFFKAP